MRSLKAGLMYFSLVFSAGFVLGLLRVPFLVPRLGIRTAELLEMPVMLMVILFGAGFSVRRFDLLRNPSACLATGCIGLAMLLFAEILLAGLIQGQSITQYITNRDPVSGAVYLVMLGIVALMPFMLAKIHASGLTSSR